MAITFDEYLQSVRQNLGLALCIYNIPSAQPQFPEIELPSHPHLTRKAVTVRRGPTESCLIETTINSARVSVNIRQKDELEKWLTKSWLTFVTKASYAEVLGILRRVPVAGYDVTFLITAQHCLEYSKDSLIDFICRFIQYNTVATELKMLATANGRAVATNFLSNLTTSGAN